MAFGALLLLSVPRALQSGGPLLVWGDVDAPPSFACMNLKTRTRVFWSALFIVEHNWTKTQLMYISQRVYQAKCLRESGQKFLIDKTCHIHTYERQSSRPLFEKLYDM